MKTSIKTKSAIFPQPVLMIATYNDDGSVNVMNAAWGMMIDSDVLALNLASERKTLANMRKRGGFTVSLADSAHAAEADYFGVESGNKIADKLSKAGLTAAKSELVDAPIVNEFPVCMECEFIEFQSAAYGAGVIGKILNVLAEESVQTNGNVDISKLGAIAYDPFTHGYYTFGERVGNAFSDGLKLR